MKREAETVQIHGGLRVRYYPDGNLRILDGVSDLKALKIVESTIRELECRRQKLYEVKGDLKEQLRTQIEDEDTDDRLWIMVDAKKPAEVPSECPEKLRAPARYLRGLLQ